MQLLRVKKKQNVVDFSEEEKNVFFHGLLFCDVNQAEFLSDYVL